jgi:hypothetical protein
MKAAGRALKRGVARDSETDPFLRRRAVNEALLEQTARLFEARCGRPLSTEDARQIIDNLGGSFAFSLNGIGSTDADSWLS